MFEDELDLNSLFNMISESILARFDASIMPLVIGPLPDHPRIYRPTHKMYILGVRMRVGDLTSIKDKTNL